MRAPVGTEMQKFNRRRSSGTAFEESTKRCPACQSLAVVIVVTADLGGSCIDCGASWREKRAEPLDPMRSGRGGLLHPSREHELRFVVDRA
jgi:hypothetical protein